VMLVTPSRSVLLLESLKTVFYGKVPPKDELWCFGVGGRLLFERFTIETHIYKEIESIRSIREIGPTFGRAE